MAHVFTCTLDYVRDLPCEILGNQSNTRKWRLDCKEVFLERVTDLNSFLPTFASKTYLVSFKVLKFNLWTWMSSST